MQRLPPLQPALKAVQAATATTPAQVPVSPPAPSAAQSEQTDLTATRTHTPPDPSDEATRIGELAHQLLHTGAQQRFSADEIMHALHALKVRQEFQGPIVTSKEANEPLEEPALLSDPVFDLIRELSGYIQGLESEEFINALRRLHPSADDVLAIMAETHITPSKESLEKTLESFLRKALTEIYQMEVHAQHPHAYQGKKYVRTNSFDLYEQVFERKQTGIWWWKKTKQVPKGKKLLGKVNLTYKDSQFILTIATHDKRFFSLCSILIDDFCKKYGIAGRRITTHFNLLE